jgi:hypothetical protein
MFIRFYVGSPEERVVQIHKIGDWYWKIFDFPPAFVVLNEIGLVHICRSSHRPTESI